MWIIFEMKFSGVSTRWIYASNGNVARAERRRHLRDGMREGGRVP